MSKLQIQLTGWKVLVATAIMLGILTVKIMLMQNNIDDQSLMQKLEFELVTELFPNDFDNVQSVLETGNVRELAEIAKHMRNRNITIKSVQSSYPLFNFSSNKEVVVKVTYSIGNEPATKKSTTNYYLFNHGTIGNSWQYIYRSNVVMYYLNIF